MMQRILSRVKRKLAFFLQKFRESRWDGKTAAVVLGGGVLMLTLCFLAAGSMERTNGIPPEALDAVAVDGSFLADTRSVLLSTDGRISRQYLKSNLRTDPVVDLSVIQVTDRLFSVRFSTVPKRGLTLRLNAPRGYGNGREFPLQGRVVQRELQVKLVGGSELDQMGINDPVVLLFSQAVTESQLQGHLSFSFKDPIEVKCQNNVAVIQPRRPLEYGARYYVSVSSGMKVGEQTLESSYNTEFRTASAPGIYTQEFKQGQKLKDPIAIKAEPLTVEVLFGASDSGISVDPKGSITLVFSQPMEKSTLEKYIKISPDVSFSILCRENTAILTPQKTLGEHKRYTLYMKQGLTSKEGGRLENEVKKYFTTRGTDTDGSMQLSITNEAANFVDASKPLTLEFFLEHPKADHQLVEISLFRMDSYEQYLKLLTVKEIDQDYGLLEIDSSTEILRNGLNTIELENPGRGAYLVRATASGENPRTLYKCLNVTDLAVYLQTANDKTLVWVNNTVSKQPQGGLRVEITDRYNRELVAEGTTGADGCAELTYLPKKAKTEYSEETVISLYRGQELAYADNTVSVNTSRYGITEQMQRYYTFFFTDRTLYHPTDTIRFWGFVKPYMLNTDPLPPTIRVTFDRGGLAETVDVPLEQDGSFTGEIGIEKVVSSQYQLEAELLYPAQGKQTERTVPLDSLWLEAKEFEKPAYVLTTEAERPLFASPEKVEASATLKFYDGTPLPDYPLEISVMNLVDGNVQEVKKVRTDESGVARFSFRPEAGLGKNAPLGPRQCYYVVTLAGDGETVRIRGDYRYQAAGVVADAQVSPSGAQSVSLQIRANAPNAARITTLEQARALAPDNPYGYYGYDYYEYGNYGPGDNPTSATRRNYDALAGSPVNVGVQGSVDVTYTDLTGDSHREQFQVAGITEGGVYRQELPLKAVRDPKKEVGAEVQITCVDNNLNLVSWHWADRPEAPQEPPAEKEPVKGYTLAVTLNNEAKPLEPARNFLGHNEFTVAAGDLMTFQLCKDGTPVENKGRILYQLMQEQPLSRQMTTSSSFQIREKVEYGKSVFLVAAYFDGNEVHPIGDTSIVLDMDSVELDVAVTPDREAYRPGDPVNLSVHVSDRRGSPVQGSVCLSVVDESLFALSEQYIDVVGSLYEDVSFSSIFVRKYTTTLGDGPQYATGGDGGKGGGDMEAYDLIREDFKDTALFLPLTTDAGGNASASFQLPDNITSWRVTTVSVGGNLYGGQNKDNLITTLPFFSKPVITSSYTEGDQVSMLVQGHGDALKESARISYQVRITGDGLDRTITADGEAYQQVLVNFGKLPAGEYMVASTAQYGDYRDTVNLPLTVVSSNLELVVHKELDPQEISGLSAARFPVTLAFYDKEHEPFYRTISTLLTHYCSRADQRLSRYVAKKALMRYYSEKNIPRHIRETDSDISDMQREDGGISWWNKRSEDSDPVLTAKIAMAVGDQFNRKRMVQYFEKVIESSSGVTKAAAYAGLASLKPEAVRDINKLLNESSLPMEEKLYYLAGLAWGGDAEQALALYQRDVSPYVKVSGSGRYLAFTNRKTEDDALTATAWLVASRLGLEDADDFAMYFSENRWGISTAFESMAYVANYQKTVPELEPVLYSVDGKARKLSLGLAGQASLTLTKSELESIRFDQVPQGVQAMAYYIGEPEEADLQPSENITITKVVADEGDKGYRNNITVRFKDEAPTGFYDISDCIPSNMRYFSMGGETNVYCSNQELQRMYFTLKRRDQEDREFKIVYYTRKAFEAATMLDRVYIVNADSGEYAFSERRPL